MEEATGLRRRHVVNGREVSPERDNTHAGGLSSSTSSSLPPGSGSDTPSSSSVTAGRGTPGAGASVLGALGRGVLGVSKWTLGSVAGSLGPPFAWAEFMFAWVNDVTPPRLKRLATIFWDAGSHITKLAYTPAVRPMSSYPPTYPFLFLYATILPLSLFRYPSALSSFSSHPPTFPYKQGAELGFAARNVIDGVVETIAAPKGRAVVLESGMTFVKFAEAMDTPEMHAAITQGFKVR